MVEGILNHRPLCYVSAHDVEKILTPAHLMGLVSQESDTTNVLDVSLPMHSFKNDTVLGKYWKVFYKQYIANLTE